LAGANGNQRDSAEWASQRFSGKCRPDDAIYGRRLTGPHRQTGGRRDKGAPRGREGLSAVSNQWPGLPVIVGSHPRKIRSGALCALALGGRTAKTGLRLLGGNVVTAAPDLDVDLSGLDPDEWTRRIDEIGEDEGYYQRIGAHHAALFIDAGPRLLVSFENRTQAMSNAFGRPRGFEMATRENWSLLTILADGDTWFRAPELFGYFDRLVDDGFLEDFDRVLFFGVHDAGYAAGAYSVTAPGASALLIRPIATLDPAVAPWERRFLSRRRLDFTSRYGYAPDMVEALDRAHVIFDPTKAADAMHAALYRGPNVSFYPTRQARPRIEALFDGIGITAPLMKAAMDGTLDRTSFARLWRRRRESASYVRNMLKRMEIDDRPQLAARVCAYGMGTPDAAFYEDRIAALRDTGFAGTAAQ